LNKVVWKTRDQFQRSGMWRTGTDLPPFWLRRQRAVARRAAARTL